MKRNLLYLLILGIPVILNAQDTLPKNIEIKCAYFGDFIVFPGVKVGIGYPLFIWEKEKHKTNIAKLKEKRLNLNGNLFAYNHIGSYTSYSIYPEITYHTVRQNGLSTHLGFGIGFFRTRLHGYVYEVDEHEKVHKLKNPGRNRLATILSAGIGYDLRKTINKPLAIHFTPTLYFVSPEAVGIETHSAIELGVRYFSKPNPHKNEKF